MPRNLLRTAQQLERLPTELIEPILAEIRLGDLIALWNDGGPALRLVIASTSTWKGIWPEDAESRTLLVEIYIEVLKANLNLFNAIPERYFCSIRNNRYLWRNQMHKKWELGAPELRRVYHQGFTVSALLDDVATALIYALSNPHTCEALSRYSRGPYAQVWAAIRENSEGFFLCDTREAQMRNIKAFTACYQEAQVAVNSARNAQILQQAHLYGSFPTLLMTALAPQTDRPNQTHVKEQLLVCAKRITRAVDIGDRSSIHGTCHSLFRFDHTVLVPYDWCLKLWFKVLELCPFLADEPVSSNEAISTQMHPSSPSSILSADLFEDIHIARLGLEKCYRTCPQNKCKLSKRNRPTDFLSRFRQCEHYRAHSHGEEAMKRVELRSTTFCVDDRQRYNNIPVDGRELEWLASFCRAIAWMQSTFPEISNEVFATYQAETHDQRAVEQQRRIARTRREEVQPSKT